MSTLPHFKDVPLSASGAALAVIIAYDKCVNWYIISYCYGGPGEAPGSYQILNKTLEKTMEFGDYFPKILPNIGGGGQNHIPAPLSKYWGGDGAHLDPPVPTPMF